MSSALVCWKCGASLAALPLPLSRLAECPACRAWLHACRLCQFYEPRLAGRCREERAEEVRDKEGANFCDWFKPRTGAYRPPDDARTQAARAQLDGLFGGAAVAESSGTVRDRLDSLFRVDGKPRK
jgi:hypothetical protein